MRHMQRMAPSAEAVYLPLRSGGPTVAALAMAMPPKGHIAAVCMTTARRKIWENVKIEPISVRIM